jgi:hypothetical protein
MMIERVYSGSTIRQRSDGWISLTDMAKAAGKKANDWMRLQSTEDFVKALASSTGIPVHEHIQVVMGAPETGGGSWAHPRIAHHFAMWCSPEFAVKVTGWVEEIRTTGFATSGAMDAGPMGRLLDAVVRMLDRLEAIERRLDGREERSLAALPLGATARPAGYLITRVPTEDEYRSVSHVLWVQHILVTDPGQRSKLGKTVAVEYRVEAKKHADWPPEPLLIPRAGNRYPPQTWEWLDATVRDVAGRMGLLPGTAVHQASLWNGTGGPLDVSVTVP